MTTSNSFRGLHYTGRSHVVPASSPRQAGVLTQAGASLDLVVDEYTVKDAGKDAQTWVLTHGTSFNRLFWRIVIDELLDRPEVRIRTERILAIDTANHGDSAVVNSGKLADKAHWPDFSRDILCVLDHVGCREPVIGIGHSFGGGILCHAALMQPSIFAATVLVEPILFVMPEQDRITADQALRRRDTWTSLDEVKEKFSRSKGLADWDQRQLDIYAESGTYCQRADHPQRTLKTPKAQEAATYIGAPFPGLLDLLASSAGIFHYILGEQSRAL